MLKIEDIIELKDINSQDKLSFATRYLVQVNFTFDLTVKSNSFSGTSHFCVRKDQIKKLCNELRVLIISLNGTARIEDFDSDAFLEFTMDNLGRVYINGQVGGSHEDDFMKFNFSTDSIATGKFIQELEGILTYVDDEQYEKEFNQLRK